MQAIRERLFRFFARRRYAYQSTFKGALAQVVLEDLANFCRAHESTFHKDSSVAQRLDGRREVWLRIQQHLRLSPDELWALYTGNPPHPAARAEADDVAG